MISQQTANDKIAIPTIHLIELTAWHDVGLFEIKQAARAYLAEIEVPQAGDPAGQVLHPDDAVLLQFAQSGRAPQIGGKIQDGLLVCLDVRQAGAIRHCTCQIVPTGRDVSQDVFQGLGGFWRA